MNSNIIPKIRKRGHCKIIVSEFELQSRYDVHFRTNIFGKGINPLYLPAIGLIVSLLSSKNGFGIK